jgi:hypothetical protein
MKFTVERKTLITPAMESGIADHVWPTEELIGLI